MLYGGPTDLEVIDPDVRVVPDLPSGDHDVHPHQVEPLDLGLCHRQGGEDHRVGLAPGRQLAQEPGTLLLALDLVDEHVELGSAQHRGHAREHRAVEPRVELRHHDGHPSGLTPGERAGLRRDDVGQVVGDLPDPLAGRLADSRDAAESARDGGDRDARVPGDVGHVHFPGLSRHAPAHGGDDSDFANVCLRLLTKHCDVRHASPQTDVNVCVNGRRAMVAHRDDSALTCTNVGAVGREGQQRM